MLFDNMDLLLNHSRSKGWQDDMAYALAEAFTGNKELCLRVRGHVRFHLASLVFTGSYYHTLSIIQVLFVQHTSLSLECFYKI